MEKKEGIAVYIYRMQDKRDDKSQSPLFLSRAAARYAFGEGGEGGPCLQKRPPTSEASPALQESCSTAVSSMSPQTPMAPPHWAKIPVSPCFTKRRA